MMIYQKNLKILSKRFPLIYLHLLTKNKNSFFKQKIGEEKKANLKNFNLKNPLNKLDTVYIYKCKDDRFLLKLKKWLIKKNKKLIFIEDDLQNLQNFFSFDIANDLLKKENVDFYLIKDIKQDIQDITKKSLSSNIEVITFADENKKFLAIKENIFKYSLINFFSTHDTINSHRLFKNFIKNFQKLKSSFLVNKFEDKFANKPAIILGAGPSLNYCYAKLKKISNKALIIAGGSAITSLTNQGILPHFSVIIDPNIEEFKRLKDSLAFEIPILYSTRVNSAVFNTFNGPIGYIKAGINSFFEVWIENELNILGRYLKTKPDDIAFSVTPICLSLAKLFGCNPIIIDGVDLAFSENKYYASSIIKDNKLNDNHQKDVIDKLVILKDKNDREVYSNLRWQVERQWFSSFAKRSKNIKFFNVTKLGLKIDNFEDTTLDIIEKKYLNEDFDFNGYIHTLSQNYILSHLEKVDFKALKLKLKKSFLKCQSYLKDIIKNDPEYKAVLAKEEIKDEIAYKYFLFEIEYTLNNFFDDKKKAQRLLDVSYVFLRKINI